jgi:hypothetical protein
MSVMTDDVRKKSHVLSKGRAWSLRHIVTNMGPPDTLDTAVFKKKTFVLTKDLDISL